MVCPTSFSTARICFWWAILMDKTMPTQNSLGWANYLLEHRPYQWTSQDQLLLHATIASTSESVMLLIASAKTSNETREKTCQTQCQLVMITRYLTNGSPLPFEAPNQELNTYKSSKVSLIKLLTSSYWCYIGWKRNYHSLSSWPWIWVQTNRSGCLSAWKSYYASKGLLHVSHGATSNQLADALTKPLSRQRHVAPYFFGHYA